ncbi:MAG: glycosyltransferase [Rhizobiales bacterium]|nr:glycosyltransferase [Hyphomicrobiales bacterium]
MIAELEHLGWQVDVVDLGDGFPRLSAEQRMTAREKLMVVPGECPIVIDGLAFGVLPETAARLRVRHPVIALVHHPLALESHLGVAEADAFRASERAALAAVAHVVVTSDATARLLTADYDVPADRITVARPGNDPVPAARSSSDGIVRLLAVGSVVPRKGFDVLVAALATLTDLPWRLTIAGDGTRDPAAAARLDGDIASHKLGNRIAALGAVPDERIAQLYAECDVFALASRFEGYGMALADAIAHGLPVVTTTAGAIPETVPAGAGVLVAPDDAGALALALRRLIEDPDERRRLATAARAAAAKLPTWRDSARLFSRAIEAVT